MKSKVLKYALVTLSTFFGVVAAFFAQKAGSSSPADESPKSFGGLLDIVHADVPPVDATYDPGCSGCGCSGCGCGSG